MITQETLIRAATASQTTELNAPAYEPGNCLHALGSGVDYTKFLTICQPDFNFTVFPSAPLRGDRYPANRLRRNRVCEG